MSSDASYLSFLNKANASEPLSASSTQQGAPSTSQASSRFDPTRTASVDAAPTPIATLLSSKQPHYTSDTDSPFEPFFLTYAGEGLPTGAEFGKCLSAGGKGNVEGEVEVEVMEVGEWDARGQYAEVVKAVGESCEGGEKSVKVYRLTVSGTRGVYFVVGREKGGKEMLVGMKVEAVES